MLFVLLSFLLQAHLSFRFSFNGLLLVLFQEVLSSNIRLFLNDFLLGRNWWLSLLNHFLSAINKV